MHITGMIPTGKLGRAQKDSPYMFEACYLSRVDYDRKIMSRKRRNRYPKNIPL
jgi:hypothetical protein